MFGFLVNYADALQFDLLQAPVQTGDGPIDAASRRAREAFVSQVNKNNTDLAFIRSATLKIQRREPAEVQRAIFTIDFHLELVSDRGKRYCRTMERRVWLHDPRYERQS